MSVIIKQDGLIKLLIKGADSAIIARLSKTIGQPFLPFIEKKLYEFSRDGLRTLCLAIRILTPQ